MKLVKNLLNSFQLIRTLNKYNRSNLLVNVTRYCSATAETSDDEADKFETLKVNRPSPYVTEVELHRPEIHNAMNLQMFKEIGDCFRSLNDDPKTRVIILSAVGKHFTAGLDLTAFQEIFTEQTKDASRKALSIRKLISSLQQSFLSVAQCQKPIISLVHNGCIGAGVDLISATDIRYATSNAWFQVKEVDIGLAADLGTLQYFPKVFSSQSVARELVYTARKLPAIEAEKFGFVSNIHDCPEAMKTAALEIARKIVEKSPIAVQGSKVCLDYSRDHTVEEGLKFMLHWNMSMLQTDDIPKSVMAATSKSDTPDFDDV